MMRARPLCIKPVGTTHNQERERMTRTPYPLPEALSQAQLDVLNSGAPVLNVSKMLMHMADPFWMAQRSLARAAVYDSTIGDGLRELLILRVAHLCRSDYELFHHLSIARSLGVSPEACAAMASGDFTGLSKPEAVLAQFVSEVVLDVSPSDAALAAAREIFSDAQIFEMIAIVGYYMMVARAIAVGGVEIDTAAVENWPARS